MRAGNLRVRYWAVDPDGTRRDEIAIAEQEADGRFQNVFTSDPRAMDLALEMRDGETWREVRSRRIEGGPPRVLPGV